MTTSNKNRKQNTTDNLLAGLGSLLSVFSGYNNVKVRNKLCVSDKESMKSDWKSIGNDLRKSISQAKSGQLT